jgi:hypothetical protein
VSPRAGAAFCSCAARVSAAEARVNGDDAAANSASKTHATTAQSFIFFAIIVRVTESE